MSNVGDMLFLIRETEKRGFKSGMGVSLGPCEVSKEYSYTIDPFGKIYKCGGFVGRKEFVIGDLSKQGFNYKLAQFMTTDTWRGDCRDVPICLCAAAVVVLLRMLNTVIFKRLHVIVCILKRYLRN